MNATNCAPNYALAAVSLEYLGNSEAGGEHRRYVRFYGVLAGPDAEVVSLWDQLTEADLDQLGVEARMMAGGGLILPDDHSEYETVEQLVAAAAELIGLGHASDTVVMIL